MPTKEEIYDQQINPLMAQIIEICREHKIATLCTFSLAREPTPLLCTTYIGLDGYDVPPEFAICRDVIIGPLPFKVPG